MKDPIRLLRRIAVTVAGTVILAVGVVLLVAPGPGLVVIALALAVFAIESPMGQTEPRAPCRHSAPRRRPITAAASRVATASAVLFGVGAIGLGAVLVFTDLLPFFGAGTGGGVAVGGLTVLLTTAYGVRGLRNAEKAEEDSDAE